MALLAAYLEKVRDGFVMMGQKIGETQYLNISYGSISEKVEASSASLIQFIDYYQVNPLNPKFLLGIFIGAMVVYVFSALTIKAVGGSLMVKEVRRQFTTMPGIPQGKICRLRPLCNHLHHRTNSR